MTQCFWRNHKDQREPSCSYNPLPVSLGRGVFAHGYIGSYTDSIDYITIDTAGNASDFGDLTLARQQLSAASNGPIDRGIFAGGYSSIYHNTIDYITISHPGNAIDFGDLTLARWQLSATSNGISDRGIFGFGANKSFTQTNIIDCVTISSGGSAAYFGDLIDYGRCTNGATSNGASDRGIFGGSYNVTIHIEYITISSGGNAVYFGDFSSFANGRSALSNGTSDRGVFGGKYYSSEYIYYYKDIEYVTISSAGNALDFGDLTIGRAQIGATSNGPLDRGVFGGGPRREVPLNNEMEYITISSGGNAIDFGDLTKECQSPTATAN